MSTIRIEFFGIARSRAGMAETRIEMSGSASLGRVLELLASKFPQLENQCISGRRLQSGYTANVDGARFISDPETPLSDDSCLLIMSSDVGG